MVEVRPLDPSDAQAWWRLRLEALEADPCAFGRAAEEHRALTLDHAVARFRNAPPSDLHLGAFIDGELVGTATFVRETSLKERHKGHVYSVYVTAARRRQGVARALLARLLDFACADETLETVLLTVGVGQTGARALYRSFGFVAYGLEPRSLKVGDVYVDEELLFLRVRDGAGCP
jgi:ribosomal protein S18 acetylase RimI-like enzyme